MLLTDALEPIISEHMFYSKGVAAPLWYEVERASLRTLAGVRERE